MANFYFTYRFAVCTHIHKATVNSNGSTSVTANSKGTYTQSPFIIPTFLNIETATLSYNMSRSGSSSVQWNGPNQSLQFRNVSDSNNIAVIHTSSVTGAQTISLNIVSGQTYDIHLNSSVGARTKGTAGSFYYYFYFNDIHLTLGCNLLTPNTILTANDLNQLAQILQVNQTLSNAGDAIITLADAQAIGTGVSNMYTGWDALNLSNEASQNPVTHLSPVTFDSTKPLYADIQNVISAMTDNHVVTIIEHT